MENRKGVMNDIDSYIAGFPASTQILLKQLRATIRKTAPGAGETISYGIPAFILNGPLVYFAAYKNHIGLYPAPRGVEAFRKELSRYKGGKGSVQFPLDTPLPIRLIDRIVRYRMKKNLQAAAVKVRNRRARSLSPRT